MATLVAIRSFAGAQDDRLLGKNILLLIDLIKKEVGRAGQRARGYWLRPTLPQEIVKNLSVSEILQVCPRIVSYFLLKQSQCQDRENY